MPHAPRGTPWPEIADAASAIAQRAAELIVSLAQAEGDRLAAELEAPPEAIAAAIALTVRDVVRGHIDPLGTELIAQARSELAPTMGAEVVLSTIADLAGRGTTSSVRNAFGAPRPGTKRRKAE